MDDHVGTQYDAYIDVLGLERQHRSAVSENTDHVEPPEAALGDGNDWFFPEEYNQGLETGHKTKSMIHSIQSSKNKNNT